MGISFIFNEAEFKNRLEAPIREAFGDRYTVVHWRAHDDVTLHGIAILLDGKEAVATMKLAEWQYSSFGAMESVAMREFIQIYIQNRLGAEAKKPKAC